MSLRHRDSAFSRNEIVVIVVIVGSLAGLLFPAVQSAREAARRMSCGNNLKQVALAMHNYHDTYHQLPSGWLAAHSDDPSGADSWAWSVMIIPFLEWSAIYDQLCSCRFPPPSRTEHDIVFHSYHCPSVSGPDYNANYAGYSRSDYAGVHGGAVRRVSDSIDDPGNGVFGMNSSVRFADIEDGTEFTLLVGERSMTRQGQYGAIWMRSVNRRGDCGDGSAVAGICHREMPLNDSTQGRGFLSWHPGGAQFAMVDGSVHFLSEEIEGTAYECLAQIHDGSDLTAASIAHVVK